MAVDAMTVHRSQPYESYARERAIQWVCVDGDAARGVIPMQYLLSAPPSIERLESPLSLVGIAALRDALQLYARGQPVEAQLLHAANLLSEYARRRNQRVEQLLVELKRTWRALPEVRRASRDARAMRTLLSCFVAMCIEQFYAVERGS